MILVLEKHWVCVFSLNRKDRAHWGLNIDVMVHVIEFPLLANHFVCRRCLFNVRRLQQQQNGNHRTCATWLSVFNRGKYTRRLILHFYGFYYRFLSRKSWSRIRSVPMSYRLKLECYKRKMKSPCVFSIAFIHLLGGMFTNPRT
jgi:hypothetical protein